MKKLSRILFLCALLALLLCGTALAAGEMQITAAGFYDIGTTAGVTISPDASTGTVVHCRANVDGVSGYEDFYANADKLTVTVSGVTNGTQCAVFLVTGSSLPTQANTICYINQEEAAGGTVSFTVFPNLSGVSGAMTLFITGNNGFVQKSVSLYYTQSGTFDKEPYTLGDVNDDTKINAVDALLILQYAVGRANLNSVQMLAADVNLDGKQNAVDALNILQFAVGKPSVFGN